MQLQLPKYNQWLLFQCPREDLFFIDNDIIVYKFSDRTYVSRFKNLAKVHNDTYYRFSCLDLFYFEVVS